jgi:hypothetical protein
MLTAVEVQKLIDITDMEIIAHGYTFGRKTIDIYFDKGQLIRMEENKENKCSEFFDYSFFIDDVKRFYINTTNAKLIELFETFGNSLSMTA